MAKIETFMTFDYDEFEKFVMKEMGIEDYSFVADEEANNDTQHAFLTPTEYGHGEYLDEEIQRFKENYKTKATYSTYTILEYLIREGRLPEGNFLIFVSW